MAIRGARQPDRSLVPHLLVRNAAAASEFYQRAFGARELNRSQLPQMDGHHIKLRIGSYDVWVTDESPPSMDEPGHMTVNLGSPQTLCGTSVVLELCVDDADATFAHAVDAGATPALPISDTFWGDRYGWVKDPFGHIWGLTTIRSELTPQEVAERMAAYMQCAGEE